MSQNNTKIGSSNSTIPITNKNEQKNSLNQNSKSFKTSISQLFHKIKTTIQNELKLKKIIQRAQKIDFMSNIPDEDKIDIKHFLFINIFFLFNGVIYGGWMFSNKQYRKLKYISIYLLGMTYLGLSFSIFWQDQTFFNKISTKQDAYKSQIKYVLRKECLQNIQNLERLQHKRQMFKKLNLQFQKFHQIRKNSTKISLLV